MEEQQKPSKKVAIYVRVSTEEQVERYGKDLQLEAIKALVKSRGKLEQPYALAGDEHVYCDDGVSGTIPLHERPAFARLKEAVEFAPTGARPFDVVAVYRIDRFARKLTILLEVIEFFDQKGIEFLSVNEAIDTSTPFGRAVLSIIGVIAELERETIKDRTQAGRREAIKKGVAMGSSAAYGYTKNQEKQLVLFEQEADIVREIFKLFTEHKKSVGDIASSLKMQGRLSPEASAVIHGKRKGEIRKINSNQHWRPEKIRAILQDELYIGNYYFAKKKNGKPLPPEQWQLSPTPVPQIIDVVTFEKARQRLGQLKHQRQDGGSRHSYLLSGLLRCHACYDPARDKNGMMHWGGSPKELEHGSGRYTYYYICGRKNTRKHEIHCSCLPLPAEEIEKYVIDFCLGMLESPVAAFEHQQQLKSTKSELRQLDSREQELLKLMGGLSARRTHLREQQEFGHIDITELNHRMAETNQSEQHFREQLQTIQRQRAESTMSESYISTLDLFRQKYRKMLGSVSTDRSEIYDLLHLLIEEITLYSRPVTKKDTVAGRKKDGQQIAYRMHIKLHLPQTILNEIGAQQSNEEPPSSDDEGGAPVPTSSRPKSPSGGR